MIGKEQLYSYLSGSLNIYRSHLSDDEDLFLDDREYEEFKKKMDKYGLQLAWPEYYLEDFRSTTLFSLLFIAKLFGVEINPKQLFDPEAFVADIDNACNSMPPFNVTFPKEEDQVILAIFFIDNLTFQKKNVEAISRFGYGNSVSELVQSFLVTKDEKLLLDAISIDTSVRDLLEVQNYIKSKKVIDDQEFLKHLSQAERGISIRRNERALDEVRLVDAIYQDTPNVEPLSANDFIALYVNKMKIYKKNIDNDYSGSLLKLLNRLKIK